MIKWLLKLFGLEFRVELSESKPRKKYVRVDDKLRSDVINLHNEMLPIDYIVSATKLSRSTVYRIIRDNNEK